MLRDPKTGPYNVSDFQISALPWVTSSTLTGVKSHTFSKVTSFLLVKNPSPDDLYFAFTLNGLNTGNYITLKGAESLSAEVRVKKVYLSGSAANQPYEIFAGLTVIDGSHLPLLTGSIFASGSNEVYWEGVG